MNKLSDFIVNKRKPLLAVILLLAIICGILMTKVYINSDLTKYLSDESQMKQGLDVMGEEFPDEVTLNTIRVMVDDLSAKEKTEVLTTLEGLEYADSVSYEADSADYNKENHTLYIVNTEYAYNSAEEVALENSIKEELSQYETVVKNDDTNTEQLPLFIIAIAVLLIMVVLFAMCSSWIEPLLFLATIGIAVVINLGTNYFLGSVSNVTFMIAALLQLVLSMDYSIMLMSRYRQELEHTPEKNTAMKQALSGAVSSIMGSSITTVVGLLVLCFLDFKIGMDLGIVLAKGVFISMLSVFTVLPCFILMAHNLVQKTQKKALHIPTGKLARFSYRARFILAIVFVAIFVGSFFLRNGTETAFTLESEDPIAEIFPTTNTVVLLYDNKDDKAVTIMAEKLEENENIKSVTSYSTSIGKPQKVESLAELMDSTDSDMDPELLKIIYYDYYCHDDEVTMTMSQFLNFINDDVMTNETLSSQLDSDMTSNIDQMMLFADAGNLTSEKSISQLAGTLGMDKGTVEQLMLLYYSSHSGVDPGKMTIETFTDFIIDEVAQDPAYKSMFDKETLATMSQMSTYTDARKMTTPYSYSKTSEIMGMDKDTAKLLYVYYYSMQQSYDPGTLTLGEFTDLILNKAAADPVIGSQLDEATLQQVQMLATFADKNAIQQQMTSAQLSAVFGIDEAMIQQLFMMAYGPEVTDPTMSMLEFANLLLTPDVSATLDQETLTQVQFMATLMNGTMNDKSYTYQEMAGMLGMDQSQLKLLYTYGNADTANWKLSVQTIVHFITDNEKQFSSMMDKDMLAQLKTLEKIIDSSVSGTAYTPAQMAGILGMDKSQLNQLYLLYQTEHGSTDTWKLSLYDFVCFLQDDVLTNKTYASQIDSGSADSLTSARTIMDAVLSGRSYTPAELTQLLSGITDSIDANTMDLMALYYGSTNLYDESWTLSIHQLFEYLTESLLQDSRFDEFIDDEMRNDILEYAGTIEDGVSQLQGSNYSRLIITSTYPAESAETSEFIKSLFDWGDDNLSGNHYLIGNSVMTYEMESNFDKEMAFITWLTAISIFIVVAITFKSLIVPLILVLIVQCGVYLTVTTIGFQGYSIYYLALLIVQSILMGATIDYGILFSNYYRETRRTMGVREALTASYDRSIHTIMTSGLILTLVCGIVGKLFENPTIGQICSTISTGALCACLLILFILPGILAALDKIIMRKNKIQ